MHNEEKNAGYPIEKETMTVGELATLLGISENMVYRELYVKHIPAIRLGRKWIICRQGIMTWLANAGRSGPVRKNNNRGET